MLQSSLRGERVLSRLSIWWDGRALLAIPSMCINGQVSAAASQDEAATAMRG